jgi:cytochrome c551/c552|tara:strand:- start:240 stop:494 length:255 start_codon:yes stop_codon:yes gene_type:complete
MTTLDEERIKILTDAYEHRKREVMHHQINIDNYTLALAEIAEKHPEDEAMAEFANRLRDLLASSIVEQAKEVIMRDVMAKQLAG